MPPPLLGYPTVKIPLGRMPRDPVRIFEDSFRTEVPPWPILWCLENFLAGPLTMRLKVSCDPVRELRTTPATPPTLLKIKEEEEKTEEQN